MTSWVIKYMVLYLVRPLWHHLNHHLKSSFKVCNRYDWNLKEGDAHPQLGSWGFTGNLQEEAKLHQTQPMTSLSFSWSILNMGPKFWQVWVHKLHITINWVKIVRTYSWWGLVLAKGRGCSACFLFVCVSCVCKQVCTHVVQYLRLETTDWPVVSVLWSDIFIN